MNLELLPLRLHLLRETDEQFVAHAGARRKDRPDPHFEDAGVAAVHPNNLQRIQMLDQLYYPISPIQINPVHWKVPANRVSTGGPRQPDSVFVTWPCGPWP